MKLFPCLNQTVSETEDKLNQENKSEGKDLAHIRFRDHSFWNKNSWDRKIIGITVPFFLPVIIID